MSGVCVIPGSGGVYKNWQPHWMFVGEITEVEDRR